MRRLGRSRHAVVATAAMLVLGAPVAAAASQRSAPAGDTVGSSGYSVSLTLMTYDIRSLLADGSFEGSGRIPSWSKRAPEQAHLIRGADPDVIAIQEGGTYLPHSETRQVDSLGDALGGRYRLARTEIPPDEPHHFRTGDYIIYNNKTVQSVGAGGHFSVGDNRWAAYHEFIDRATGSTFLFVCTHLTVGLGSSYDAMRKAEAKTLARRSTKLAQADRDLVFFGGDFNSSSTTVGPGKALRSAHLADSLTIAHATVNGGYDSDNENLRSPAHNGVDIDHLYVPDGVKVYSAGIVLRLHQGRFEGPIPSDHNPVVADVSYPPSRRR